MKGGDWLVSPRHNAWRHLLASRLGAGVAAVTVLAQHRAPSGVLSSFPKLPNGALGPPPDADGVYDRPDGYVHHGARGNLSSISDVRRISA